MATTFDGSTPALSTAPADLVAAAVLYTLQGQGPSADARLVNYFGQEQVYRVDAIYVDGAGTPPDLQVGLNAVTREPQISKLSLQEVAVLLLYRDFVEGRRLSTPEAPTAVTVVNAIQEILRANYCLQQTTASAEPLAEGIVRFETVDYEQVNEHGRCRRSQAIQIVYQVSERL